MAGETEVVGLEGGRDCFLKTAPPCPLRWGHFWCMGVSDSVLTLAIWGVCLSGYQLVVARGWGVVGGWPRSALLKNQPSENQQHKQARVEVEACLYSTDEVELKRLRGCLLGRASRGGVGWLSPLGASRRGLQPRTALGHQYTSECLSKASESL